jgi:enamine deaminase RidA (YjgF/YER057c/UK114 family)
MQPAGHLGAGAAQVLVPLGPDLEHSRVILPAGLTHASRAQCRDRDRAGVVRVVLVRVPRGQQPLIEQARVELFGDHKPADTLIGVARLARPEFLIEVDAIAVK